MPRVSRRAVGSLALAAVATGAVGEAGCATRYRADLDAARAHVAQGSRIVMTRAGRIEICTTEGQRAKLERLCRYVSRPPMAEERLALTSSGQVRYAPTEDPISRWHDAHRDGTTGPDVTAGGTGAATAHAPDARVRDRYRGLHSLRREACDHRQHRGAGSHREDPGASGEDGPGSAPTRAATRRTGAADTGTADLTAPKSPDDDHLLPRNAQPLVQVHAPSVRTIAMPLAVRRTGERIRVEAPVWAAGMVKASREWVGFRMPAWRDSVEQVV